MKADILDDYTRFLWRSLNSTHKILDITTCTKCAQNDQFCYRMKIRKMHRGLYLCDVCNSCFRKRLAEHLYQLHYVNPKYRTRKRYVCASIPSFH